MKATKASFLVFLCVVSLCFVGAQQVMAQYTGQSVYILSDGSVYSSTNATVPIQRDGDVYTFTNDLVVYSFLVQRNNVVIDGAGFSLLGESDTAGIDLTSVSGVTIKNVNVEGSFSYGVYLAESYSNTIMDNTISGNDIAVGIYNGTLNTVTGNSLTENNLGVELLFTTGNVFRNNNLDNTRNIAVYATEVSQYVNDVDDSNTIANNKKVYYLIGEENLEITSETFPDVGFLALVSCTNVTVQDIDLTNNEQGIILADTTESTLMQNSITDNQVGVMLFASSYNTITGNTITSNNRGIQLSMGSTLNTISINELSDNVGGLFLFDSPQNRISGNTIENNDSYGVGISASSYNVFLSNHFLANGIQVYDAGTVSEDISVSFNSWFVYPAGGNYWSDYTGTDVKSGTDQDQDGSDNLGDTPYIIYGSVQDDYPRILDGALLVSVTSPENKTYTVNSVTLTVTANDSNAVLGYSLDGQANITTSGTSTLSNLAEGPHELAVYAKNTEGKESSQTVYFTISEDGTQTPIDNTTTEDLPITLIAAIATVAVVGLVLLYFLILKNK